MSTFVKIGNLIVAKTEVSTVEFLEVKKNDYSPYSDLMVKVVTKLGTVHESIFEIRGYKDSDTIQNSIELQLLQETTTPKTEVVHTHNHIVKLQPTKLTARKNPLLP